MKTTLVACDELAACANWHVLDCRHDLTQPDAGERMYREGHIPSALHAHLDRDLSGPKTGHNGRHPLPDPAAFMAWLGRQGITPGDQVVAYDAGNGMFAARLWWLLRWVGHRAVAVLDGGLAQWLREGRALSLATPEPSPTVYNGTVQDSLRVDADFVLEQLQRHEHLIVDARAADRFAGLNETLDPRAGHIPGAVNRPFTLNVDGDGRFHAPERLRAEFTALLQGQPPQRVVAQCGSGVTACHHLLALEVAGLPGARLYPGSWSEWCSDPQRPVATGAA